MAMKVLFPSNLLSLVCAVLLVSGGIWWGCNQDSGPSVPPGVAPSSDFSNINGSDSDKELQFASHVELQNWLSENYPGTEIGRVMAYQLGRNMRQSGVPESVFDTLHDTMFDSYPEDQNEEAKKVHEDTRRGYYGEESGFNEKAIRVVMNHIEKQQSDNDTGKNDAVSYEMNEEERLEFVKWQIQNGWFDEKKEGIGMEEMRQQIQQFRNQKEKPGEILQREMNQSLNPNDDGCVSHFDWDGCMSNHAHVAK